LRFCVERRTRLSLLFFCYFVAVKTKEGSVSHTHLEKVDFQAARGVGADGVGEVLFRFLFFLFLRERRREKEEGREEEAEGRRR
jgi:hypothetical protein